MNKALSIFSNRRCQNGFTIIELMVTLTVAGILASIAAPSIRSFLLNTRITSETNDLLRATQLARSQAIKTQFDAVLCSSANLTVTTPTCNYASGTATGWIVFQDTNSNWQHDVGEELIESYTGISTLKIASNNNSILSYGRSGFINPPGAKTNSTAMVICDSRGNTAIGTNSTARALLVSSTGRTRTTKIFSEISTAISATGSCT